MAKTKKMYYDCCCVDCGGEDRWNEMMKGRRKISYKWMVAKIRRECPEMVEPLMLDFNNPYADMTYSTNTHYVLTNSAIEYFFRKIA